jgi:hypothetical protein
MGIDAGLQFVLWDGWAGADVETCPRGETVEAIRTLLGECPTVSIPKPVFHHTPLA